MNHGLDKRVEEDIITLAKKNAIKKVILFGSRARGDHSPRSDIDLAVSGGDVFEFSCDVEEKTWTLLMFDVVNLDQGISQELQEEIDRDGVALYEEV